RLVGGIQLDLHRSQRLGEPAAPGFEDGLLHGPQAGGGRGGAGGEGVGGGPPPSPAPQETRGGGGGAAPPRRGARRRAGSAPPPRGPESVGVKRSPESRSAEGCPPGEMSNRQSAAARLP